MRGVRECGTSATNAGSPLVEQFVTLGNESGIKLTHLAMALVIAHLGVSSAIAGPRTMKQLEDTLAGLDVVLSDDIVDRIDEIVPPRESIGAMDMVYRGPKSTIAACGRWIASTR